VGHGAHQFTVLNDRRAGHLCVKDKTKIFTNLFVNYASGYLSGGVLKLLKAVIPYPL
jgi:hypothetical protein